MKIERNLNSVVVEGGPSFEMESNERSMLTLFNKNNDIKDGCVFKDDGYIHYKNGTKKKYFVPYLSGNIENLWLGNKSFKKLIPLYKKLKNRHEKIYKKISVILERIYENGGVAHAIPTHEYQGEQGRLWKYNVNKTGDKYSYGFDWIEPKGVRRKNMVDGELLYRYSDKFENKCWSALRILCDLVWHSLPDKNLYNHNDIVIINVDGVKFTSRLVDVGYKYWDIVQGDVNIEEIKIQL